MSKRTPAKKKKTASRPQTQATPSISAGSVKTEFSLDIMLTELEAIVEEAQQRLAQEEAA